jgi:hypothetical protein
VKGSADHTQSSTKSLSRMKWRQTLGMSICEMDIENPMCHSSTIMALVGHPKSLQTMELKIVLIGRRTYPPSRTPACLSGLQHDHIDTSSMLISSEIMSCKSTSNPRTDDHHICICGQVICGSVPKEDLRWLGMPE